MGSIACPADLVRVIRRMYGVERDRLGAIPQMAPIQATDALQVLKMARVDPSVADALADWLRELLPGMDLIRALAYTICALAVLPAWMLRAPVATITPLLASRFQEARRAPQQ